MNKVVSLPRISSHHSEKSQNQTPKSRKISIKLQQISAIDSLRNNKVENTEETNTTHEKIKHHSLKRIKSDLLQHSSDGSRLQPKQQRYGLNQNGQLSKIQQFGSVSNAVKTERSQTLLIKPETQDKSKVGLLKKQLNELASSILILQKQIKSMKGVTLQLKQQAKNHQTPSNIAEQNDKVQQKIEEVRKKNQWAKFDQEILKNTKDRLKQILIHLDKKTGDLKQTLSREKRKIKIISQRTSVREESINKKKLLIKEFQQKQKISNKLVQLQLQEHQKKVKQLNAQKQQNLKKTKTVNSDDYHYQVYKKEEASLLDILRINNFLNSLLDSKYIKYFEQYSDVQKAEKLMQTHSIQNYSHESNPLKVYFGSFERQKELENKIKLNEAKLAQTQKKNADLRKLWQNIKFKETQEEQSILKTKALQIKSGRIKQQYIFELEQRQMILEVRRKRQIEKNRSTKMSQIKEWIIKTQKLINISNYKDSNEQQRLNQIIERVLKSYRKLKAKQEKQSNC